MKNSIMIIFAVPLFFIPALPGTATATDTIICVSPKYEVQIHVSSENTVADIIIYDGKPHEFNQEELEGVKLKWIASVTPFEGNSLTVKRNERTNNQFSFEIEVNGVRGKLKTANGEFHLECDWTR